MTTVTVIIPTLNEADNVDILLNRIFKMRKYRNLTFDVLFIDSASSDATCEKVAAWKTRQPVDFLRLEKNIGLAGAVLAGANKTTSELVVVMDADLSHPPEKIPELLQPLFDRTHDMVIGSRYVTGGAMPDWPFSRKLSSLIATFPAKFFCAVQDPLAGFFALKRSRLNELSTSVPGFKIGLAVLAEYGSTLRVKEVPIEFRDRDYGESKMNRGVIADYLRQLLSLTNRSLRKKL